MIFLVVLATALVLIPTAGIAVLIRRERRRLGTSLEARRIESAATRGIRDARRQAHAYQHFNDAGGISSLRDRDSNSSRH
jgi:hypothetical protein